MTAQFSNAMTGSGRTPGPWLFALPGFVTITFVFDMFDLGQPNLVLLAMMLFGFWLLQQARPWMAGSMFALATAIKVFPGGGVSLSDLAQAMGGRREHGGVPGRVPVRAAGAVPRLSSTTSSELKTWYQGMVGSSSEKGFGQRDEQNWSWVNQSIIAVTHRLTRPVNYNQDDPSKPPRTMNVADLDFKTANWIVLAISFADRARISRGDAAARRGGRRGRMPRSSASCSA